MSLLAMICLDESGHRMNERMWLTQLMITETSAFC